MDKLISIIVPTYNMERYLDRCLSSLILHDLSLMSKFEVLVINDGSTDRSSEIAHKYEEKYPNTFIVVDKENGNYGSCINVGVKVAKGKYFRILDADDWFDIDVFEQFLYDLSKTDVDIVFTKFRFIQVDGQQNSLCENILYNNEYSLREIDFAKHNVSEVIAMHGMTYKTSVLRNVDLTLQTGISYTDTEFCFYPLSRVETVIFFDYVLYQYDVSRENQTMSISSRIKSLNSMEKVFYRISKYIKDGNCINSFQRVFLFRICCLIYTTVLLYQDKTYDNNKFIKQVDSELRIVDAIVYGKIGDLKYNRLSYVSIWRIFNLYNTSAIFCMYNFIYDKVKELLKIASVDFRKSL